MLRFSEQATHPQTLQTFLDLGRVWLKVWLVVPNLPNSENGRLRNTDCPIKHKIRQTAGFRFILVKTSFPVEKHEDESGAWQQKVCQTFRLLEQKVRQAFQTCQTCRVRNWGVHQTQILSFPSLSFSKLAQIKNTLIQSSSFANCLSWYTATTTHLNKSTCCCKMWIVRDC